MPTHIRLATVVISCWIVLVGSQAVGGPSLTMAPLSDLPGEIQHAPEEVRDAYRFAVMNQEILSKIPCYCSCETWDHESNYDCYLEQADSEGSVKFSSHALG